MVLPVGRTFPGMGSLSGLPYGSDWLAANGTKVCKNRAVAVWVPRWTHGNDHLPVFTCIYVVHRSNTCSGVGYEWIKDEHTASAVTL